MHSVNFVTTFFISLSAHLLFLLLAMQIDLKDPEGSKHKTPLRTKVVRVPNLDQLRVVGMKDSPKDNFTVPMGNQKRPQPTAPRSPKMDLKNLGKIENVEKIVRQKNEATQMRLTAQEEIEQTRHEAREQQNNEIQESIKKRYQMNPIRDPRMIQALGQTDFNIQFDPPKGIPEDELNKIEQVFFGFRKRIFETYVSSFLTSLYDYSSSNPGFNIYNHLENETIVGRVTFDQDGNIRSIKMLEWSKDDHIQRIFEKTLRGIHSLPNPPKAFVENTDSFDIYYHLVLRRQM